MDWISRGEVGIKILRYQDPIDRSRGQEPSILLNCNSQFWNQTQTESRYWYFAEQVSATTY